MLRAWRSVRHQVEMKLMGKVGSIDFSTGRALSLFVASEESARFTAAIISSTVASLARRSNKRHMVP
jgi:hypothetical protein